MCGFAGYVGQGNQDILRKMAAAIKYRGPDDEGFYCQNQVGLGHRRLSIIDLKGGHQPMSNEDGKIQTVFNGEIYNYQELKLELISQGHQFKTNSDTEVIVHGYEEWGQECFKKFNGMFAVALWDGIQEKLVLARDRLGKKPLYYALQNNVFVFASELKSLTAHPAVKKELDFNSLNKYLAYEYVPAPWTIFKDIFKLEPGHCLVYSAQGKNYKIERFWDISFQLNEQSDDEKFCLAELDNQLNRAVKSRLMAEVPLGVLLSGGIDSSAIAYYAQQNSNEKIKTFFIGFTDKSFDESQYAEQTAKFLKTEHYSRILQPSEALELIPEIYGQLDEPMADPSLIPTYLLSKITRQRVTVALGGDGGDELFAGYDPQLAHKIVKYYEWLPGFWRRPLNKILVKIADLLPVSDNNLSFDFKLKKLLVGLSYPVNERHQVWLGSFSPSAISELLAPAAKNKIDANRLFEDLAKHWRRFPGESTENKLLYLDFKQYLADDILTKVDRASMYNSLEVRAPFLDYQLVDFVCSLPFRYKFKGWQRKYLLKKLMRDKLPKEIVYRKKKGFGIPLAGWLKNELKEKVLELLSEANLKEQGIFNPGYVKKLLDEHFSGRQDNRKLIWTLAVFQMWRENYLN